MKTGCNSIGYVPEQAVSFIHEIETLANIMEYIPEDFEKQRRILVTHIQKIDEQLDGSFRFYFNYSSPNCKEWQPPQDSNLD